MNTLFTTLILAVITITVVTIILVAVLLFVKIKLTPVQGDQNSGLVKGENIYTVLTGLKLTTNATSASDVGNGYTISAKDGDKQYGNYQVTFTNGVYTVNKRPITITIVDKNEYLKLMNFLDKVDPNAFVTVYDVNKIIYRPKL